MTGAMRMAARAAFAAGAGLVHAVAPAETVAALVQAEPDLQTLAHPFDVPPSSALRDLVATRRRRRDRSRARPRKRAPRVGGGGRTGRQGAPPRRGCAGGLSGRAGRAAEHGRGSTGRPHASPGRVPWPVSRSRLAAGVGPLGRGRGRRRAVAGGRVAQGCSHRGGGLRPSPAHRRRRQPWARHRRQRRRAERDHRHRARPGGRAADRRRARSAGARPGRRHRRPQGVGPKPAADGRGLAMRDLWREWELLRRSPPPPRPPVLLELARPQNL